MSQHGECYTKPLASEMSKTIMLHPKFLKVKQNKITIYISINTLVGGKHLIQPVPSVFTLEPWVCVITEFLDQELDYWIDTQYLEETFTFHTNNQYRFLDQELD